MALDLGKNGIVGLGSYVAVGRETALGTYASMTTGLTFISQSMITKKEGKMLEEMITRADGVLNERIGLNKSIEGSLEYYYRPNEDAANYLMQMAFGGTVASSVISTAVAYLHTFNLGNMDSNKPTTTASDYKGLCLNTKKGGTDGKVFQYHGCRVSEFVVTAALDDSLKMKAGIIGIDSTTLSNDIGTALTFGTEAPFLFTQARISVEDSIGACTTATYWHVQGFELSIKNNLKADADSRELGSDILKILPMGTREIALSIDLRFDTITAYNYMLNNTRLAAQLDFIGTSITGATTPHKLTFNMPKLYLNGGADPEVGGPNEILKSKIKCQVVYDNAAGYALQALLQNNKASYV